MVGLRAVDKADAMLSFQALYKIREPFTILTLYLGDVKSQTFGVMTSTVWGHVTSEIT